MDISRTNAKIAVIATLALAASGAPVRAQHLGGESLKHAAPSGLVAVKSGAAWRAANGDHDVDRRGRRFFRGLVSDFGTPYWGAYDALRAGRAVSYDDGYDYGQNRSASGYEVRWDDNNHSPTLERRWPVSGQLTAAVTTIPSQGNDDRDRA